MYTTDKRLIVNKIKLVSSCINLALNGTKFYQRLDNNC